MSQYVTDEVFLAPATVNYPSGDNTLDPTKTAVVTDGYRTQTLTFNAAGFLLAAGNVVPV